MKAALLAPSFASTSDAQALVEQTGWKLPHVLDAAFRTSSIVPALKAHGVRAVLRYYAYRDDQWDGKLLTKDEANALHDAGISIGAVYQYHNNRLANLNVKRAKIDAEHCVKFGLDTIKQPVGSAVYFGVDGDWPKRSELDKICTYFEQIKKTLRDNGNPFQVGVYGSGLTCRTLKDRGLAELFWLPLSTGWTDTRRFFNSNEWTLYQNAHEVRVGVVPVDTNWVGPSISSIGSFDITGVVQLKPDPGILSMRRFVTTVTPLRKGPRSSFESVRTLRRLSNVAIIEEADGWSRVDTNEDGKPEGYCLSAHLAPVGQMPQ